MGIDRAVMQKCIMEGVQDDLLKKSSEVDMFTFLLYPLGP